MQRIITPLCRRRPPDILTPTLLLMMQRAPPLRRDRWAARLRTGGRDTVRHQRPNPRQTGTSPLNDSRALSQLLVQGRESCNLPINAVNASQSTFATFGPRSRKLQFTDLAARSPFWNFSVFRPKVEEVGFFRSRPAIPAPALKREEATFRFSNPKSKKLRISILAHVSQVLSVNRIFRTFPTSNPKSKKLRKWEIARKYHFDSPPEGRV